MMDPKLLPVATTVRSELDMTPEFVASLKEHGVLQPIVAQIAADGGVDVLYGQRRTVDAVDAGLVEVPVSISETQADGPPFPPTGADSDPAALNGSTSMEF